MYNIGSHRALLVFSFKVERDKLSKTPTPGSYQRPVLQMSSSTQICQTTLILPRHLYTVITTHHRPLKRHKTQWPSNTEETRQQLLGDAGDLTDQLTAVA